MIEKKTYDASDVTLSIYNVTSVNIVTLTSLSNLTYDITFLSAEVGSSALHVAVAELHFRQCSGSARYIF